MDSKHILYKIWKYCGYALIGLVIFTVVEIIYNSATDKFLIPICDWLCAPLALIIVMFLSIPFYVVNLTLICLIHIKKKQQKKIKLPKFIVPLAWSILIIPAVLFLIWLFTDPYGPLSLGAVV